MCWRLLGVVLDCRIKVFELVISELYNDARKEL